MRHKGFSLLIGIALTMIQLLLVLWAAPGTSIAESYSRLCAWDCVWYQEIARDGYHSPVPPVAQRSDISNVAFFPGYPYLGRGIHLVSGLRVETALLILAQVFCVLFWAALWMILRRWRIPLPIAVLTLLAVLAHPASFFLVAGYSESLFLSSLLFFILGSSRLAFWGNLPGIAMSATRIVGLPAAAFPVIAQVSKRLPRRKRILGRRILDPLLLSSCAALGAILFFLYCQVRFGRFDLYMETQRIGWGITPDYGALLKWREFHYTYPFDRFATLASGVAFVALALVEAGLLIFKRRSGLSRRFPLYLTAFLIFFITLSGLKSLSFRSMIRYTLPWHVLLLLCLAHLSLRLPRPPARFSAALMVLVVAGLIAVQFFFGLPHLRDYLNGQWFA